MLASQGTVALAMNRMRQQGAKKLRFSDKYVHADALTKLVGARATARCPLPIAHCSLAESEE